MIYFAILALLILLSLVYDFGKVKKWKYLFYYSILIVLICLSGFRYRVGGDTIMYMLTYNLLPTLNELGDFDNPFFKLQPLWLLITAFAKTFSSEFYVLQFIHAIILNTILFNFFRKYSNYLFTVVLFYYISYYFYFNFEILRESLAIAVFILSIDYLIKRKWYSYFILSLVAFLIHFSAIILFIFPLLYKLKFKTTTYFLIFIFGFLLNPYFSQGLRLLGSNNGFILSGINYLDYKYTLYGLISIMLINLIYPLFINYLSMGYLRLKNDINPLMYLLIFLGSIIPLFYIFYRFTNYLIPVMMLILANSLVILVINKTKRASRPFLLVIALAFIFFIHTNKYFADTSEYVSNSSWYSRWYPYYSIFDKQEDQVRERLISEQNRVNL